ncbi:MAG: UDP-galactopyranose mutase [Spirochaetes bacterium]|nr:UDP-galactopyranose mutase [Spirochaetota bacterium]
MSNYFDYVVVGAGFAGSVISERIANKLNKRVLIIEKRNHIGGNCYDFRNREGIIVHKYGPHLFHTSFKEVFDYLSNFAEFEMYSHKVLAVVDGKKIPVPFNFNSIEQVFPQELSKRLQRKLLNLFPYGKKIPILELRKVDDNDIKFLADFIYEKVFLGYTTKQWGRKPEEIDPEVTSRVPIFIGRDDRYFYDTHQAVPVEGYTKIFENMILNNQNIKIILNTDFKEVLSFDWDSKKVYLFNQEFKGRVIFTGMIDELFGYKFGFLSYRSLEFNFQTVDTEYFQEVAQVNYPNDYDFTRITEFKHIHSPSRSSRKTTIAYEYPREYKVGMIPYYPLFTKDSREQYERYKELADKYDNIVIVGRLAEYKYYDMDDIVKRALEVFEEKVK